MLRFVMVRAMDELDVHRHGLLLGGERQRDSQKRDDGERPDHTVRRRLRLQFGRGGALPYLEKVDVSRSLRRKIFSCFAISARSNSSADQPRVWAAWARSKSSLPNSRLFAEVV